MTGSLRGKSKKPLYIDWELDALPLSPRAFRVYVHLIRRLGQNETAWPSYQAIGDTCFTREPGMATPKGRRNAAIRAVKELVEAGLVGRAPRRDDYGNHRSNNYVINDKSDWKIKPKNPSDMRSPPSDVISPEVTTNEVTTREGTTTEDTTSELATNDSVIHASDCPPSEENHAWFEDYQESFNQMWRSSSRPKNQNTKSPSRKDAKSNKGIPPVREEGHKPFVKICKELCESKGMVECVSFSRNRPAALGKYLRACEAAQLEPKAPSELERIGMEWAMTNKHKRTWLVTGNRQGPRLGLTTFAALALAKFGCRRSERLSQSATRCAS